MEQQQDFSPQPGHTANGNGTDHLLLFGATGRTGKYILKIALERGYSVTAIARNPVAITLQHPNLTVIQGDVFQPETFLSLLYGKHAVLSCLGRTSTRRTTLYSEGMTNILSGMARAGVGRVICISASGLDINPTHPWYIRLLTRYVLQRILRHPFADLRKSEGIVKASGLSWTIMRPPALPDKPGRKQYRIALDHHLEKALKITCEDLADCMVNIIDRRETFQKTVEIGY